MICVSGIVWMSQVHCLDSRCGKSAVYLRNCGVFPLTTIFLKSHHVQQFCLRKRFPNRPRVCFQFHRPTLSPCLPALETKCYYSALLPSNSLLDYLARIPEDYPVQPGGSIQNDFSNQFVLDELNFGSMTLPAVSYLPHQDIFQALPPVGSLDAGVSVNQSTDFPSGRRTTHACDLCHLGHRKCNGLSPCGQCAKQDVGPERYKTVITQVATTSKTVTPLAPAFVACFIGAYVRRNVLFRSKSI
ncbi:hypothetical protein BC938DRAFT_475401 [Jimgerdemannia flammicorona]|uniref:Zn(2)-C6 fungal-type domain-containing protein n=1 Tax=Jimgerdemannia flammicorona TaxID=994334 RepID=A0A433QRQ1_9FUNG|nr:hypothetical protein BC938DRAFT_475401 [Jimgerdemannia flammicorona]